VAWKKRVVPNASLTRGRDGSSGAATFKFNSPNIFDASTASFGEITGMFMIEDEGHLSTTLVPMVVLPYSFSGE
jgi:photosystem II protein